MHSFVLHSQPGLEECFMLYDFPSNAISLFPGHHKYSICFFILKNENNTFDILRTMLGDEGVIAHKLVSHEPSLSFSFISSILQFSEGISISQNYAII